MTARPLSDGLCPHGRHEGAVCTFCDSEAFASSVYTPSITDAEMFRKLMAQPYVPAAEHKSGLDAPYYHLPQLNDLMDLIEWLEDGGMPSAMMNVMKSIVREYNPEHQKDTDALYEAEKRYYFSKRHLEKTKRKAQAK